MKKETSEINSFLEGIKKRNTSSKSFEEKKKLLLFFLEWKKKNLKNISLSIFPEKHLQDYLVFLEKKNFKKKDIDNSLKIISRLLRYIQNKEEENEVQQIVNYYFQTKGYTLDDIKEDAKKKKIIYSRYTRPAKNLLLLAGSLDKAKDAIKKVALWANTRNLDYAIETVFKKWPEINSLKPKEKEKKPYYRKDPMIWSKTKNKWYVINKEGDWLEFAGDEKEIEWKEEN
jgi:hypothetical protein